MNCETCGASADFLHIHHVLPKTLGGIDENTNLVHVCEACHSLLHQRDMTGHTSLVRKGLRRAKQRGTTLGQPPKLSLDEQKAACIMVESGQSKHSVAEYFGVSSRTVRRIYKRYRERKN